MSPHKSRLFYGYWILTVAFLCLFLMSGFVKYSFSLYVRRLAAEFDWSRAQIMAGSTITGLVMGISALVIGRIIYHYRARKVIATGALVAGCGLALLSLTRELWYFYLVFAVVGAGAAGMGVVVMSTIVSNWFRKRRGWAIGILGTGIGAGGFAMPLFVGVFLIPSFGWRTAYLVSGLLTLLLIVPLSFLVIRLRPADKGLLPVGNENPKDDNGLKLQIRNAEAFSGDDLQKLRGRIEDELFLIGEGSVEEVDVVAPYVEKVTSIVPGIREQGSGNRE